MIDALTPPNEPPFATFLPDVLRRHLNQIYNYAPPVKTLQKTVPENIKDAEDKELTRALQVISEYLSLPVLEDNFVDKDDERDYRNNKMQEDERKEWERNMLRANRFTPVHDAVDILGGRPEIGQHIKTHENKDIFVRNGYYLAEFRDAFWHAPTTTMEEKRDFDAKKKAFSQEYSIFVAEVFDAAVEAFNISYKPPQA